MQNIFFDFVPNFPLLDNFKVVGNMFGVQHVQSVVGCANLLLIFENNLIVAGIIGIKM